MCTRNEEEGEFGRWISFTPEYTPGLNKRPNPAGLATICADHQRVGIPRGDGFLLITNDTIYCGGPGIDVMNHYGLLKLLSEIF